MTIITRAAYFYGILAISFVLAGAYYLVEKGETTMKTIFNATNFRRRLAAFLLAGFGLVGTAAATEPPLRLISYTPDYAEECAAIRLAGGARADEEPGDDAVLYAPPSDEVLAALEGEPELLVFTTKERGICPACDRARPSWTALLDKYPITPVYCTMSASPKSRGDLIAKHYEVEAFPTFVLVVRNADGTADELDRWKGCGSFMESTGRRIARAFDEAGFAPRIEREGIAPPKRKPRPIPGVNPPRRDEPKPPRRSNPRNGKDRPRFGFSIGWDVPTGEEE